jgi:hypothetical protein
LLVGAALGHPLQNVVAEIDWFHGSRTGINAARLEVFPQK